jgi:hypothetical protein
MFLTILGRIGILFLAIGIGFFFFPVSINEFVTDLLGYQKPSGFFGFSFADWSVTLIMSTSLWVGILFSFLGKKIDYIFIVGFFALASLDYYFTGNMTWLVYSGLVGATILGVTIGVAANRAVGLFTHK